MIEVPLLAVKSQTLTIDLGDQAQTRLNVYNRRYGLFIDVLLDNVLVIGGVICLNKNRIVRSKYLGYSGDFIFFDTQGTSDPTYDGLGDRYQMLYLTPAEIAATEAAYAAAALV